MLFHRLLQDLVKDILPPTQPSKIEIQSSKKSSKKNSTLQNTTNKKGINGKLVSENILNL